MQQKTNFLRRMVPALAITAVSLCLSVLIYNTIITNEKEDAWRRLEIATTSTAGKIEVRIRDNLSFLEAVADAYILRQGSSEAAEISTYLSSVRELTIFERISVAYKDGTLIMEDGRVLSDTVFVDYEGLNQEGSFISRRMTVDGEEVLYCYSPIVRDEEVIGVLIGVLDCETITSLFSVATYGKDGQIFVIDLMDGNYIIDNWHEDFGNMRDLGQRTGENGKPIDLVTPTLEGETFRSVYYSKTNGQLTYQYTVPVLAFGWSVSVAVQEDVIYAHVNELDELLFMVGGVEVIVLLVYMGWSYLVTVHAVKSEEKARLLEVERASNTAKAKFISNMSHDIRTPINGILGMLHIIRNHRDDEVMVDECLHKIDVSTHYLSTLASDMLDINDIENNQSVLEQLPFNMKKLIEELEVLVGPKVEAGNVNYSVNCEGISHPYVIGSEIHIQRVLVNLIGNAIKYSKETDAKVWVTVTEKEIKDNQVYFCFEVGDNGIGMTEEFQKTMFEAFSQEKVSARSSYEGYGLGLTIVNHLVKRLGGTIEIESKKDVGSTFFVTLPLTLDKLQRRDEDAQEVHSIENVKILVVEDNEFNMEIAEVLLTDAGAKVTKAYNGRIATELFAASEEFEYNVILMDVMMPEMDGCEATLCIRQMERPDAREIPIIAMTAAAFTEEIQRCMDAGMNEHMTKPLDMDKLINKIAKYCK